MEMEIYKRKAVFAELSKYDHTANEHDYIEVTEWKNGEGVDVEINSVVSSRFQLTWGQFRALSKLVKKLDNLVEIK